MKHADAVALVRDLLTDRISAKAEQIADVFDLDMDTSTRPPEVAKLFDLPAVVARAFDRSPDGNTYTLAEWAGVEQLASIAEQHPREQRPEAAPAALPCPTWCDRAHDHPFDRAYGPDAPARRDHVHRFSDRASCVALELIERTPDPQLVLSDLRIDHGALAIRVDYAGSGVGYLTGSGARRLAAQLLEAADLYDTEAATITGTT